MAPPASLMNLLTGSRQNMGDLSASQASLEMATSVLGEEGKGGTRPASRRPSAFGPPAPVQVAEEGTAATTTPVPVRKAVVGGDAASPSSPLVGGAPTWTGPGGPKAKGVGAPAAAGAGAQLRPRPAPGTPTAAAGAASRPKVMVKTGGGAGGAATPRAATPKTATAKAAEAARPAKSDNPVMLADLASVLEDAVQSIYALDNAFRDQGRIYRHLQTIKVGVACRPLAAPPCPLLIHTRIPSPF